MKNEEVLQRVKEERNLLDKIKSRKANWIGYNLKHVIERRIQKQEDKEEDVSCY
jgi:hypothetical protein